MCSNLKCIKKWFDYVEYGGVLLLGVNGIFVIGYGSSKVFLVVSVLCIVYFVVSYGVMEDFVML